MPASMTSGQPASSRRFSGIVARGIAVCAIAGVLGGMPEPAAAAEPGLGGGQSLEVLLSYPDQGITGNEQLCLGIYPGTQADLSMPPLQARCVDPGETSVLFEDITDGEFVVAIPGAGSRVLPDRYQGQLVQTAIPDDAMVSDYAIDVSLDLAPELAGTRGRVEINVYGCPEGTDGGEDATAWAGECQALADGIPLSLSGKGAIGDTAMSAVTGTETDASGKVLFTNLPAGAYELGGLLPGNVSSPAIFIESSIEGGLRPITEGGGLALRPAENLSVNVYLVLSETAVPAADSADTVLVGFTEPQVTGGLTRDEAAAMQEMLNALP
jgi:hypothetical protein